MILPVGRRPEMQKAQTWARMHFMHLWRSPAMQLRTKSPMVLIDWYRFSDKKQLKSFLKGFDLPPGKLIDFTNTAASSCCGVTQGLAIKVKMVKHIKGEGLDHDLHIINVFPSDIQQMKSFSDFRFSGLPSDRGLEVWQRKLLLENLPAHMQSKKCSKKSRNAV